MSTTQSLNASVRLRALDKQSNLGHPWVLENMAATFKRSRNLLVCHIDGAHPHEIGPYERHSTNKLRELAEPLMEAHLKACYPSLHISDVQFTWKK